MFCRIYEETKRKKNEYLIYFLLNKHDVDN